MCHSNISQQDALAERLFQGTVHTLELFGIYIGKSLGLYRTLHGLGTCTPPQLAQHAGIHVRYAQEWLEQQAVADLLTLQDPDQPPLQRRYELPHEHVPVLVDDAHLAHVAPFAQMLVGIARAMPRIIEAYRTGTGVPYAAYGPDFRDGQGGINRPAFSQVLAADWLRALPGVHSRLVAGEALRVLDLGCGEGWAAISVARNYPACDVVGVDTDVESIAAARRNAAEEGVRVHFDANEISAATGSGNFDLVLLLETLHDLPYPEATLRSVRQLLCKGGWLFIADERVAESFVAPGDAVERMMYGWSITHCLPSSMHHESSAAIGTAIRPATVSALAEAAGFEECRQLGIQNDLFRFWGCRR